MKNALTSVIFLLIGLLQLVIAIILVIQLAKITINYPLSLVYALLIGLAWFFIYDRKSLSDQAYSLNKKIAVPLLVTTFILSFIFKPTYYKGERIGNIAMDGTYSHATGRGASSYHGGVKAWVRSKRPPTIYMLITWHVCYTFVPLGSLAYITIRDRRQLDEPSPY